MSLPRRLKSVKRAANMKLAGMNDDRYNDKQMVETVT